MTNETLPTETLRTGETAPRPLVTTTVMALTHLLTNHGVTGVCALSDLSEMKEDRTIPAYGEQRTLLESLGLLDHDGRVHQSIVPILRASIAGEGLTLHVVNPLTD